MGNATRIACRRLAFEEGVLLGGVPLPGAKSLACLSPFIPLHTVICGLPIGQDLAA